MLCYHGTTRKNAETIINGGNKATATWNCSDDNYLYIWTLKGIVKAHCMQHEDIDDIKQRAIESAFESAQITAACSEEAQSELVVLCFDIPLKWHVCGLFRRRH